MNNGNLWWRKLVLGLASGAYGLWTFSWLSAEARASNFGMLLAYFASCFGIYAIANVLAKRYESKQ